MMLIPNFRVLVISLAFERLVLGQVNISAIYTNPVLDQQAADPSVTFACCFVEKITNALWQMGDSVRG